MSTSSLPPPLPFRRSGRRTRPERRRAARARATATKSAATKSAATRPADLKRLKVDQPEDLLALVPYLLGFMPRESLVMMVISDRTLKVTMRVDLIDDAVGVAQRFGAVAVNNRATGVVLIAYSDDAERADAMLLPVMEKLASLRVIEAIYTDGRRWWSRSCSADCCPAEGTPYEMDSNRLAAEAVYCGMTSYADRSELERLAAGPPDSELAGLRLLADEVAAKLLHTGRPQRRRQIRQLVTDYVRRRERGDEVVLADRDLVTLALLATDVRVRDEAWAVMDRGHAWIHVELWQQVVARAIPDLATPALCLLGMAAWIKGQGALQVCCLERARKLNPDYSMTNILDDINLQAIPPSAWDRMRDAFVETMGELYD